MTKPRKIALWGIAAVASVLVLSALALHTLTDSEHVKQIARDHVRKSWARELAVGKLSLSFTPMPEYRATDVAVSNPAWAHDKTFLEAKELNARIAILPLLTGRIVVERLSVEGFKIRLQDAPDGRKSWKRRRPPHLRRSTPLRTRLSPACRLTHSRWARGWSASAAGAMKKRFG